MNRSETIGELAKALAKAQGELRGASKTKVNPHLKNKYADLESVWEAIREPITKHGLSIVQGFHEASKGSVMVETMLLHESGEWMESQLLMPLVQDTPQGMGSAITYGRRYSLMAIVGIAPEDDDAEGAMGRKPQPTQQAAPTPPPAKPTPPAAINPQQLQQVGIESTRLFKNDTDAARKWISATIGREIQSRKDLTNEEAASLIRKMSATKETKQKDITGTYRDTMPIPAGIKLTKGM